MAAAAVSFWLAYSHAPQGVEGDFWWHLETGRRILGGHLPFTLNPYGWSALGHPWVNHEWLGEVFLAGVYGAGGLGSIKLVYWALLAGNFGLLTLIFTRAGCALPLATFGALAASLHMYAQLWPRLQGISIFGLTVTALILQAWWQERDLWRWVWVYPLFTILWINMHGAAIVGPASCAIVLATDWGLATIRRKPLVVAKLAILTGLSTLSLLINPIGPRILTFALEPLYSTEARAMYALVAEWGPFRWDYSTCQHFVIWIALIAAAGLAVRKWPPAGMLALAVVWAALAVSSRRNLPLFGMAAAPLAAYWLAAAEEAWKGGARRSLALAGILAFLIVAPPAMDIVASGGRFETGLAMPSEPAVDAIRILKPERLLNLYDWGGLLIANQIPVFIDGRQDAYGLTLNLAHNRMMGAAPGWKADLARYRIDAVLAPPGTPLIRALSDDARWHPAFADPTAILLLRKAD